MKVRVYWNFHKKLWSVQSGGKVVAWRTLLVLDNCKFTVQPAGRERVRREGVKNIHAFVDGEWVGPDTLDAVRADLNGTEVTYNPKRDDTFITRKERTPIFKANRVVLSNSFNAVTGERTPLVVAH